MKLLMTALLASSALFSSLALAQAAGTITGNVTATAGTLMCVGIPAANGSVSLSCKSGAVVKFDGVIYPDSVPSGPGATVISIRQDANSITIVLWRPAGATVTSWEVVANGTTGKGTF